MAILELTAPAGVLLGLPQARTVRVSVVRSTATDRGDGSWSVTVHATEDQIPALRALGCTVRIIVDDATQLARWHVLDGQIERQPPVG